MAELSGQAKGFIKLIEGQLPGHGSVEEAGKAALAICESMFGPMQAEAAVQFAIALEFVKKEASREVEILRAGSLLKVRPEWYKGPRAMDRHWPALQTFFESVKKWDADAIASIDATSNEVVSLLGNPGEKSFRCRGLVVGYVQSGKTANMTAVIAKAVDAGYNLIVVLGGVTKKLRAQTQRRLESDVVQRYPQVWHRYTDNAEDGDFVIPRNGHFTMPIAGHPQILVMKKVVTRLDAFLQTIRRTARVPTIMGSLRTLIIDDECDQASVNAKEDDDPAKTNKLIREIIQALPAVSYVGYTATPFANVFINPFPRNKDVLDDLYPEDFITALPRPKDYFGAREVFGFAPDDAAEETGEAEGRNMLRIIPAEEPNNEVKLLRPSRGEAVSTFLPQVTTELENAVLWFLLTCAVRRRRGQETEHMTMLIHTSQSIKQHGNMKEAVSQWVKLNSPFIRAGSGVAWDRMTVCWENETSRYPLQGAGEAGLKLKDLLPFLVETLNALEIVIENSASLERLNYAGQKNEEGVVEEKPRTYIVVGGSVLARGLTLEGLVVSFFLRTALQYDTLLQMGRWFGYRHGYSDLPRLWASEDLISSFRALAQIEEEIREDIRVYRERKASPLEFAVRVRSIPGMAITAAGKMRHAHRTSISFEGRHVQTIRFDHKSAPVAERNWDAASELIDESRRVGEAAKGGRLMKGVPLATVRRFLVRYSISDQHLDLKKDLLLAYLDKSSTALLDWNVGVVLTDSGPTSNRDLGQLGRVGTNRRSRLAIPESFADIKALMSKGDILIDAANDKAEKSESWQQLKARRAAFPLLLIYPINRESIPERVKVSADGRPSRVPLDATMDLVGIGIVFPGSEDRSGDFYSVDLEIPTPEQLAEEEPIEVQDE